MPLPLNLGFNYNTPVGQLGQGAADDIVGGAGYLGQDIWGWWNGQQSLPGVGNAGGWSPRNAAQRQSWLSQQPRTPAGSYAPGYGEGWGGGGAFSRGPAPSQFDPGGGADARSNMQGYDPNWQQQRQTNLGAANPLDAGQGTWAGGTPGGEPQYTPLSSALQPVAQAQQPVNQQGTISGMQMGYGGPQYQPTPDQMIGPGALYGAGLGGAGAAALLAQQQNNAYGMAKKANELRYGQIMGGYNQQIRQQASGLGGLLAGYAGRLATGQGMLGAYEAAAQAQIAKRGEQQQGKATQGLISSGLGNTSVGANVTRGIKSDENFAYGQLAGQMAGAKSQLYGQYSGDYLNALQQGQRYIGDLRGQQLAFMERRKDSYPQMQPYMSAMQGLGAGQQNYANAQDLYNQRGGYY